MIPPRPRGSRRRSRSALVAFSANAGAQELVARLLSDARLGDRQTLFLLDTVDASTAKTIPGGMEGAARRTACAGRAPKSGCERSS